MATKPVTPENLIAAAKRLRRRGMKKISIKANDYLLEEMNRLGRDVGIILDTYFTLGSRLNKGYKESFGSDYTSNGLLREAASGLLGVKQNVADARDEMQSGKSTKDIENAADDANVRMLDLIDGLSDDLNDILVLAKKVGNRDVINAIEILRGSLS